MRRNHKVRMLVSSKNDMFLEGIRAILSRDPSIEIVGEARQLGEMVEEADSLHPDVVLLDGVLTDFSTLEAIQQMRRTHANLKILALSVSGRLTSAAPLLAAGASVYVSPEIGSGQLFRLIHAAKSLERRGSANHVITSRVHSDQPSPRTDKGSLRIVKRKSA